MWCLDVCTRQHGDFGWLHWKKKGLRLCVAKSIFRISFERTSYKLKKHFHLYGHYFEHRGRVIRSPKLDLWWGIWTAFSLGRGEFKDKSPGIDIKASIAPIKNCGVKVHSIKTITVIPIKIVLTLVLIIIVQITLKITRYFTAFKQFTFNKQCKIHSSFYRDT